MNEQGFSLVELTIVLFIMGLLVQASIEPLGQRLEQRRRLNAAEQLRQVQEHLRAHWVSYGHLPCPIVAGTATTQRCLQGVGGVPAAELSMMGAVSASGELLDPWGHTLKYVVSLSDVNVDEAANTPDWLTAGDISQVLFTELEAELEVCLQAIPSKCAASDDVAADLVAVVVSGGSTRTLREEDNWDSDSRFIHAPFSSAEPHEFDDQLIWIGRSELIYLALQSGWLL